MDVRMKRLVIVSIVVVLAAAASCITYDGPLAAVGPDIETTVQGSSQWIGPGSLAARASDPDGVFVLVPEKPEDTEKRWGALRISVSDGTQRFMPIELGPSSGTRTWLPNTDVRPVVHGLRMTRPSLSLWQFPSGGGPRIRSTDSATGRVDIVYEHEGQTRRLLTWRAWNSDRINEVQEMPMFDPGRHWVAALLPNGPLGTGWRLVVFRLK